MRRRLSTIALASVLAATPLAAQEAGTPPAAQADAASHVAIMVFDASGSMWNRIEGDLSRIEVARNVMEEFFLSRAASTPLAVIAYGHRERGNCADMETIAPLGVHDGADLAARLRALNPQGMTPLTDSMAMARNMIPPTAESADLILVTDGLENCGGDPCALAADLAAQGIAIRAHVVGFGLTEAEVATMSCLPERTGGMMFQTNSGAQLSEAMAAVSAPVPRPVVAEVPPMEKVIEPVEEAAPPELVEATITGPENVVTGANFRVEWSADPINHRDMVAIVPMGSDEGTLGTWSRVGRSGTQTDLRAPSDPGLYELRYILDEGRRTLARQPIEVTGAEVTISGPDTVRTGEAFRVTWSDPINHRDMVAIVPMGSDERTLGTWPRVGRSGTQTDLRAPSDPGLYELRYILDEGRRTLARQPIEVVPVEIEVTGPDTVRAGDSLRVTWSDRVHMRDAIAIVPLGTDEGTLSNWSRVGASSMQRDFTAPQETGMYEVRYILDQGRITLGRHVFEVVDAMAQIGDGATLKVPETASPGEVISVSWTGGTDGANQRIALARSNQPLFTWIAAEPIEERSEITFTLPNEPGYYEVRFIDLSAREVLTRVRINVR